MIVRRAFPCDVERVFARLAPERLAEMTATSWHDSAARLAREVNTVSEAGYATLFAIEDTAPVAIVGVLEFGPGLAGMVWAATPEWPRIALPSHRWWFRYFVPAVLGRYRRVEFTALRADAASQRWLELLGFTREGYAYRQGKRGEDFVHFAWLNPDPAHV